MTSFLEACTQLLMLIVKDLLNCEQVQLLSGRRPELDAEVAVSIVVTLRSSKLKATRTQLAIPKPSLSEQAASDT
jgi:hypothetical protein